jgi:Tfp pilus assembly protein PilO
VKGPVNKKRKLSRGAQIALVAIAVLGLAAGGWFLVVSPKRAEAAKLTEEIEALQSQIVIARAAALGIKPQGATVQTAKLFRLAKAMPDRADMAGVILQLNRTAADTGIVFESIAPGTAVVAGSYQRVPITLEFEGDFYSLSDFLYRLRNLVQVRDGELTSTGRLFAVDNLTFTEIADSFPRIAATLTVSAYVYGTGAPVTSATPAPTTPAAPPTQTETPPASSGPSAAPPPPSSTPAS